MSEDVTLKSPETPVWWRDHAPKAALGYSPARAFIAGEDTRALSVNELRELWGRDPLIVANAALVRTRLFGNRQHREARHFDVLELFAFVRPAQFCAPSVAGLALACGYPEPQTPEAQAQVLFDVVTRLCEELID